MSGMLVFLYFVDLHAAINVGFALAGTNGTTQLIWQPLLARVRWCRATRLFAHEWTGAVAVADAAALAAGAACGLWWWLCMCEPCARGWRGGRG